MSYDWLCRHWRWSLPKHCFLRSGARTAFEISRRAYRIAQGCTDRLLLDSCLRNSHHWSCRQSARSTVSLTQDSVGHCYLQKHWEFKCVLHIDANNSERKPSFPNRQWSTIKDALTPTNSQRLHFASVYFFLLHTADTTELISLKYKGRLHPWCSTF